MRERAVATRFRLSRTIYHLRFTGYDSRIMRTNIIRVMFTLAAVAFVCATTSSELTFAGGQNSSGANGLAGTSWKLVKLQTGDDTTLVPDDGSKYTITFASNGRVTSRVDCNRASSTWKSSRPGDLQFGSWSRTSAKCAPGSLHDKIVTEGANVRSYWIKDGHLFLSGMSAGGYYELEPLTTQRRRR
jgi:heat shock protein HslJ